MGEGHEEELVAPNLAVLEAKPLPSIGLLFLFAPTDFQKVRRSWNLLLASQSRTKQYYVAILMDDYRILTNFGLDFLFLKDRRSIQKFWAVTTYLFYLDCVCSAFTKLSNILCSQHISGIPLEY